MLKDYGEESTEYANCGCMAYVGACSCQSPLWDSVNMNTYL